MGRRGDGQSDRPRRPTPPGPVSAEELWARVAALEGRLLGLTRGRVRVVAVDRSAVTVRSTPWRPAARLDRRLIEAALPFVAAGEPLPPRFRTQAARVTAILRAAGVGPGA